MPPKKGAPKGKANKQKEDQEFEALLKELNKSTAAKGKSDAQKHKDEPKHVTTAERKAAFRAQQKEKEEAAAKQLESRAQQNKLQEMLRELMKNGGPGAFGSPYLDKPNTEIETGSVTAKAPATVSAGFAAMQGWRRNMEDAHIMSPNFYRGGDQDWHLFSVMDGHGGEVVAQTVKKLLPAILLKSFGSQPPSDGALTSAFAEMDLAIRKKHGEECNSCGTTCVTTLISDQKVVCASVGDSRAVLARKAGTPNDVVPLAFDHKPENDGERDRIVAAGGHVENNRVNGNLAMSRALGDYMYKTVEGKSTTEQLVINVPDVISAERKPGDEFVVVACDGIFDVLTNDALVEAIRDEIAAIGATGQRLATSQLETIAGNITKKCLAPGGANGPSRPDGTDNMSIVIVQL